jgi:hypothetical protein
MPTGEAKRAHRATPLRRAPVILTITARFDQCPQDVFHEVILTVEGRSFILVAGKPLKRSQFLLY